MTEGREVWLNSYNKMQLINQKKNFRYSMELKKFPQGIKSLFVYFFSVLSGEGQESEREKL